MPTLCAICGGPKFCNTNLLISRNRNALLRSILGVSDEPNYVIDPSIGNLFSKVMLYKLSKLNDNDCGNNATVRTYLNYDRAASKV